MQASTWEGGIREPALVHWPGKIAAGITSWALATTYDIPITIAALAGASLPSDGRAYDGRDLTATLFHDEPSPHKCIFHWHDSNLIHDGRGLAAVRCGEYKAHFSTQADYATEANNGLKPWPVGVHDPPLLFNIKIDPSETNEIHPHSDVYTKQLAKISAAKIKHLESIRPVCSQDRPPCGGNNISLAVCADPHSKNKYPQWPRCTITPAAWSAKTCV